jgi:hypothetical protein
VPGATFGVVNRALVGTWSVVNGSLVSGYSLQALNDWQAGNQVRFTPSSNRVTLKCVLPAAPSAAANTQWIIKHIGGVNHNFDGIDTIDVYSHTADNFGAATARASFQFAASVNNPNFLFNLDDFGGGTNSTAAQYWWWDFNAASLVNPLRIGVLFMGIGIDLGYPENGYTTEISPTSGVVMGLTGIPVAARLSAPIVRRSYRFSDPDKTTNSAIRDYSVATSTTYPTYNTLGRLLEDAREVPINATSVYSGVAAGSGAPILYHEGTGPGLSTFGRPAYYGLANWRIENAANARQNPVSVDVTWCNDANNRSINPADD